MIRLSTIVSVLFLCLSAISIRASTCDWPPENPVFSIMIPSGWSMEVSDNILHAGPKDGKIYLGVWKLPPDTDLEDAGNAVGDLISDMIEDAEFGPPAPSDNNGISFLNMNGSGREKDSGNLINVNVSFFTPDSESVFILLYFGSPDAELKYQLELNDIVKSIQAAKISLT